MKAPNGLICQYFPKGAGFNEVSEEETQYVMSRLNSRPRNSRGGKQSIELFLGKAVDLIPKSPDRIHPSAKIR